MKRIILLLILILISLVPGCGIYSLSNFIIPDDAEFLALVIELDTPEKIANYMLENFTYEAHKIYAPDPYILWKTKKGDCNDFCAFGMFVANYHDYETYRIEIFFANTIIKHYIAVYNESIWYSITNNQYYNFGFNNFGEIVDYFFSISSKIWTKYIVYDYDMNIVEKGYSN